MARARACRSPRGGVAIGEGARALLAKAGLDAQTELSAAQAEIERLRERETQIVSRGAALHAELQTKLTERDAEIERLRAEYHAVSDTADNLLVKLGDAENASRMNDGQLLAAETKLTNLRVAAKNAWAFLRMARVRNAKETRDALDAAIEESR